MPDKADPKVHAHPFKRAAPTGEGSDGPGYTPSLVTYAELTVTSNYTFLTGASHPDELIDQAAALGDRAIALTDCNSLAGIVRAHVAAKETGIPFLVGCRLRFVEATGLSLFVYPTDRASYGRLCRLLTLGKRRAPKGECHLWLDDLDNYAEGLLAIAWFESPTDADVPEIIARLDKLFDDDRLSLALARLYTPNDSACQEAVVRLAGESGVPLVVVGDVYYHIPQRKVLHDALACVRHGCTLDEAGFRLFPNAERYLKPPEEMARLFAEYPEALARTIHIAERAAGFSLDQLRYEYPHEICPPGISPMEHLRQLTWQGADDRYPHGVPEKVRRQIEHEFTLIEELNYAPYFLTVHDLVRYARSRGILCQGRGAAANSAVCYCLGVTAVDPDRINLLFERFVSRERDEPPDIDIDFEHERREEVIQYIYEKYGRDRSGLTAEVITYRSRSAVRDIGKALGLSLDAVDRIAKRVHDWHEDGLSAQKLTALGFDAYDATQRLFLWLVDQILGFPRHLSQHVGGFVISRGPLCELVPIENAAMENRTVIEWDKDDIEALGILKIDVLGLGMLSCIRKAIALIDHHHGRSFTLASIPSEDPNVYDVICAADTVGVFQIESRAQMTMLPRLKPRCFYDLVIEVAIVRPGPIIGDMVHPFLRRRNGEEPVIYPDEKIKQVLGRTLGVPLFQEQAMALAIVAAGFTPGEAEKLRRTISAWKSRGKDSIPRYRHRFIEGMVGNGYERKFAEQCFERLKGFSEYGFPESHSASFALLVYASAWIKCYYPAAFAAAMINSQPMGFYAPAQIIRDARDHGVEVRPVDVNWSEWDCTLEEQGLRDLGIEGIREELMEPAPSPPQSLRLGMRMVKGLREADARAIVEAVRQHGPFASMVDLWRASEVSASSLHTLALADAFGSMSLDRQQALWSAQSLRGKPLPLFDAPQRASEPQDRAADLPPTSAPREVARDYHTVGLSLKAHPLSFLREALAKRRILTAAQIRDERCCPHGRWASVAGVVLFRQRPGTAKGVMFMTLEDETGRADLIVRPRVYQRDAAAALYGQIVIAKGRVERDGQVVHILASRVEEITSKLLALPSMSRDFQ
ncbi:MAG TPA: error-prone DNA polymerase [Phycisphaerae bacterium]|nr:error-prone DNA polymerase [Phycisphaerae bacterium]